MRSTPEANHFDALDECHRQIQVHLKDLTELLDHIDAKGSDAFAQKQAGAIEAFFSSVGRQHHADEEKDVFPPLLASGNPELVSAVKTLQQDHGWIEENWIALSPLLRAVAAGSNVDEAEFRHYVEVYLDLSNGHIAMEETLIYPESKARWAQAVIARAARMHDWGVNALPKIDKGHHH